MKALDEFIVPFKGLGVGNHKFKFELNNSFFDGFEYLEDVKGSASIDIDLLKEPNMLIFEFNIKGLLILQCDRCLGSFDFPIEGESKLIVKFGDSFIEESVDVIVIPNTENRIDLRQHIFEIICLLLPVKKVHPTNDDGTTECDTDIINRINKHTKPQKSDPRWDALKDLKL